MEPETGQPIDSSQSEEATDQAPGADQTSIDEDRTVNAVSQDNPQVVVPVDVREMTVIENEKGKVAIIHEITFGELIVSTLLMALIIFQFLSRIIRR
ncbi:hypothetical protein [Bacillus mesophilum]|uniref:Uncharacterized protein n=1 Tax=Bacillus mesophilum TaxID=1071718 RepID=A0A7V7RPC1_9BACI|nr:hypothetical protein [Bacillus mesophilum]KAB2333982.1 hypothetical protein F7732_07830 [Bacillus mesophilum]